MIINAETRELTQR